MSSSRLFNLARAIVRTAPRASLLRARVALPSAPSALFPRAFAAAAQGSVVQTFLDKKEVAERVVAVLKGFEKVDASKVTATAHFVNDLGLDSLDAVEVCMALEEEFVITIPDAEAEKILSAEDAIAFIAAHPNAK